MYRSYSFDSERLVLLIQISCLTIRLMAAADHLQIAGAYGGGP
jgi:hypothetical protein